MRLRLVSRDNDMKQVFYPYWDWEDYKNGMYDLTDNQEQLIGLSKELLCNSDEFKLIALKVISEWSISTAVNLTNKSCNRRAWLGQASCSYKHKAPEVLTRIAWSQMTETERTEANKTADKCIREYETILRNGKREDTITVFQMKLPLD